MILRGRPERRSKVDIVDWIAEDFLDVVWGTRRGWVDLPAKVGQYWIPYHFEWPTGDHVTRRISSCIEDRESLYFSAGMFEERGRNYEDMLSSNWLWADLDEVNPEVVPVPTLAWESSPDRYQAMWKLDKRVKPSTWERINQALSYYLGADHGGWDRTQVLRLPFTQNWKYEGGPPVRLMWYLEDVSYTAGDIWQIVKESAPPRGTLVEGVIPRKDMPAKARALLRVPSDAVVEGERSDRLWELECLLAEAGWGEDDIYAVAVTSAWNKWSDLRSGETQLRRDISRAIRHVMSKEKKPPLGLESASQLREGSQPTGISGEPGSPGLDDTETNLPWIRYSKFLEMELPDPKWLVEDIWTAGSHGIIGGEPKSSKTSIALALALAVASGKPFLNKYPVHTPGPVLFIQEENAPWMMQDRLIKLARYYGLLGSDDFEVKKAEPGGLGDYTIEIQFPTDVPMRFLNNFAFDLTDDSHQDALVEAVDDLRPSLVVLDPMYLIFGGISTDRADILYPYLTWLLRVSNEYQCAFAVLHHMGKRPQGSNVTQRARAGQRLLGSTTLHGWVDSAIYCDQVEDMRSGWVGTHMELEFRSMAPRKPLDVRFNWGEPGEMMKAEILKYDLTGAIVDLVRGEPGITAVQASKRLEVDKRTVIGRARDSDLLTLEGGKRGAGYAWRLYLSDNGAGE